MSFWKNLLFFDLVWFWVVLDEEFMFCWVELFGILVFNFIKCVMMFIDVLVLLFKFCLFEFINFEVKFFWVGIMWCFCVFIMNGLRDFLKFEVLGDFLKLL